MSVRHLLYRLFGHREEFETEQRDTEDAREAARQAAREARHKAANLRQYAELHRAERAIQRDHANQH